MKLINFNIALQIDNAKEVANFIKEQDPDISVFQEIMRPFGKNTFTLFRSEEDIENITKFPYKFFGAKWITDKRMKNEKLYQDFGGLTEQGNEIMSKFPIMAATNEHYYKKYSYFLDWTNSAITEPRSIILVELKINNKNLQILSLHGLYSIDKKDSEETIKQCKYIIEAAKRKDMPTIIVGDFNLLPETESIKLIDKEFRNLIKEFKIKSTKPNFDHGTEPKQGRFVMDYVFVNDKIKVNDFKVIETDISDHLPLILDFDII